MQFTGPGLQPPARAAEEEPMQLGRTKLTKQKLVSACIALRKVIFILPVLFSQKIQLASESGGPGEPCLSLS